jgi:hypothetical protein
VVLGRWGIKHYYFFSYHFIETSITNNNRKMSKKKALPKSAKTTHYRDASSGQYVKKQYADKHPKTTVKETDKKKKES